jgi:Flp pilus assembly pilin Flp
MTRGAPLTAPALAAAELGGERCASFGGQLRGSRRAAPLARRLLRAGQVKTMNLNRFRSLVHDQRGATMVEYIVIVALILLVALQAWKNLGTNVNTKTEDAAKALQ